MGLVSQFLATLAALYLRRQLTDWVIHNVPIQSDRRGNARASGQITSHFLVFNLQLPYKCDGPNGQDANHGRDGKYGRDANQ